MSRALSPTHWVYLLLHGLLFLAGVVLARQETDWQHETGMALIATAITGWVVFIYIFLTDDVRARLGLLTEHGMLAAFSARGTSIRQEYEKRIAKARDEIDVLGFGLRALREDHLRSFPNWKTRVRIRVLLLDPEFPTARNSVANLRDIEEGAAAGTISGEVRQFCRETANLIDDRFQLRLYRAVPALNIFRIDDELFWGPYVVRHVSRNSPTLLVRRGGDMFDSFKRHFDTIWESNELSRPVPVEWLQ